MILNLVDADATQRLGLELGQTLVAGSVILLEGDLGSGKTTLVQGLGKGLGMAEDIDSPTFTLVNEYLGGRVPLYHLDLYRLSPAEVADLYLEHYWEGKDVEPGIVAIEWAERLAYHPLAYLRIQLTHQVADLLDGKNGDGGNLDSGNLDAGGDGENDEPGRQAILTPVGGFTYPSNSYPLNFNA